MLRISFEGMREEIEVRVVEVDVDVLEVQGAQVEILRTTKCIVIGLNQQGYQIRG